MIVANASLLEQLYATGHEVEHLRRAQRVLQEYLRVCKTKYGNSCERYPETQESRARLQQINASIEVAMPVRPRSRRRSAPPPGGKPYDLTVKVPPTPAWIAPTIVGGIMLAGGGAALIYYSATADKPTARSTSARARSARPATPPPAIRRWRHRRRYG